MSGCFGPVIIDNIVFHLLDAFQTWWSYPAFLGRMEGVVTNLIMHEHLVYF